MLLTIFRPRWNKFEKDRGSLVEERSDFPLRAVETGGANALRVAGGFARMARVTGPHWVCWPGPLLCDLNFLLSGPQHPCMLSQTYLQWSLSLRGIVRIQWLQEKLYESTTVGSGRHKSVWTLTSSLCLCQEQRLGAGIRTRLLASWLQCFCLLLRDGEHFHLFSDAVGNRF